MFQTFWRVERNEIVCQWKLKERRQEKNFTRNMFIVVNLYVAENKRTKYFSWKWVSWWHFCSVARLDESVELLCAYCAGNKWELWWWLIRMGGKDSNGINCLDGRAVQFCGFLTWTRTWLIVVTASAKHNSVAVQLIHTHTRIELWCDVKIVLFATLLFSQYFLSPIIWLQLAKIGY